jgi:4-aminobutyrate aminotransferase-like enzyme
MTTADLLARRAQRLGPNVPTFYEEPVHVVRGEGVWLWDEAGRKYLDCYNNVPHVGHCHPRVVEAIARQAATLNVHTRYLHGLMLDYLDQLTATMHRELSTAIMTCTGSEANDLALRMARAVTGKTGVIATDHTYHGNSLAVSQLSTTSKPAGPAFDNVRFVPAPDSYRPAGGMASPRAFADSVAEKIAELEKAGHGFSALLLCPIFANEGFPEQDPDWLKLTAAVVKKAGGLIISDEIQPGLGRVGSHMWGYERAGFTPDIVTLGKALANGHPVGATVTTEALMREFRSRSRYFNTFGGNPVSCAAAMATLQVLRDEKLQANAADVGDYAKAGLQALAKKHDAIGNVRGLGFFLGAELVSERARKTPDPDLTVRVVNRLRQRGILLNFIGIHKNTLKIRPPMPFSRANADMLLDELDQALAKG